MEHADLTLDWLISSKSTHPLAEISAAKRMVAGLPMNDSVAALQNITTWVELIRETEDFSLDHRLELLDLLDRSAKNHQFKLAPEYLETSRLQKFSESRLWNTSFRFWQALGEAYLHCLESVQCGAPGAQDFQKNLPVVVGRALRSLSLQLKWTLLRYGKVEERIWRDLGRAYLFAESHGFATRRSAIYPGKHGESTAQEELLKALMLFVSAPEGLSPTKLHIAERIVAHFGGRFALHATSGPGCGFAFDLSMYLPPGRPRKGTAPEPMLRFFGPGTAAQGLQQLIDSLAARGSLPTDINLGGNFDKETSGEVLKYLAKYWSDAPAARSGRRREVVTRLTVVPGFGDTLRWLDKISDAGTVEAAELESSESWVAFNASDGGYGAVVPPRQGDWVQIGALLGLRAEMSVDCRIGVVRRVMQDEYDQRRVGIQILGSLAIPVRVSPIGNTPAAADLSRPGDPAVLLAGRSDDNGEIGLLLRAGSFVANRNLQMRFRERIHRIEPAQLIERSKDFDWCTFRLIG